MQPVEKLLLTVDQTAAMLALGRTSVYKLMGQGELAYVKIGGSRRIRIGDIDALISRSYIGGSHGT